MSSRAATASPLVFAAISAAVSDAPPRPGKKKLLMRALAALACSRSPGALFRGDCSEVVPGERLRAKLS